ncbi:hypothetical protein, partial [Burkholderia ubonensis]
MLPLGVEDRRRVAPAHVNGGKQMSGAFTSCLITSPIPLSVKLRCVTYTNLAQYRNANQSYTSYFLLKTVSVLTSTCTSAAASTHAAIATYLDARRDVGGRSEPFIDT